VVVPKPITHARKMCAATGISEVALPYLLSRCECGRFCREKLRESEKVTDPTRSVCSSNDIVSCPVVESQTWTVMRFSANAAIHFPSGETAESMLLGANATASAPPGCRREGPDTKYPLSAFQTQTSPAMDTEITRFPPQENVAKPSGSRCPLKGH
jgi:hypothetical protein